MGAITSAFLLRIFNKMIVILNLFQDLPWAWASIEYLFRYSERGLLYLKPPSVDPEQISG